MNRHGFFVQNSAHFSPDLLIYFQKKPLCLPASRQSNPDSLGNAVLCQAEENSRQENPVLLKVFSPSSAALYLAHSSLEKCF